LKKVSKIAKEEKQVNISKQQISGRLEKWV
jgi:hypothetical protein